MGKKEKKAKKEGTGTEPDRIAIVNPDKCKPKKCRQECKRNCPVVMMGKICVEVNPKSKISMISEELCVGCGICVKKCPFDAIQIIKLPASLGSQTAHRYGANSFKLHRLPVPRPGQVLGLVGTNGIGKSTAMKILSGKLKPNLGEFEDPPGWDGIIKYYRGSELQNYFMKMLEDKIKAVIKLQYVDAIPMSLAKRKKKKAAGAAGALAKAAAKSAAAASAGGGDEDLALKRMKMKEGPARRQKMKKRMEGLSFPTVGDVLKRMDAHGNFEEVMADLDLTHVANRDVDKLSGGELQRFAIAVTIVQDYDMYMFDEPSSYLDVKQRLKAAWVIRNLVENKKDAKSQQTYVICVEHDLAVLDYLSDFVCCLYGKPGGYGVVTNPFSVRDGINVFLSGYNPSENMRFRPFSLSFKIKAGAEGDSAAEKKKKEKAKEAAAALAEEEEDGGKKKSRKKMERYKKGEYPAMTRTLKGKKSTFKLHIEAGYFHESEIVVLLGENGCGKTTFIRMLANQMKSDEEEEAEKNGEEFEGAPKLVVSFKPQKITPKFGGTVRELLQLRVRAAIMHPGFQTDVTKPLNVEDLMDQPVKVLSGGELQRVAITLALGKAADIYLIDEPSAYLDSEQRMICAKVIRRFIMHAKKTAFIVEHDFIMATYLADRVLVYKGRPGIETTAMAPESLLSGMNRFLKALEVTFRRDPTTYRPRINKPDSVKDKEQKAAGTYFFMNDD